MIPPRVFAPHDAAFEKVRRLVIELLGDFLADAPPRLRARLHRPGIDHLLDDRKMGGIHFSGGNGHADACGCGFDGDHTGTLREGVARARGDSVCFPPGTSHSILHKVQPASSAVI